MDQLYLMGAYIKFASDLKPLVDKYISSKEILEKLKEERIKENTGKLFNIVNLFQGKDKDGE